eukprot:12090539-Alexandrium_andersonii.AAC.1
MGALLAGGLCGLSPDSSALHRGFALVRGAPGGGLQEGVSFFGVLPAVSCARSRGGSRPPRTPQKAPPARAGGAFWGGPRGAGAPPGTVSYTHLTLPTICSV